MSNETLFYIFGIGLAVSAVVVSLIGLKVKDFPGRAMPVVVLWFAIFVVGATTFAVKHAAEDQKAEAAKLEKGSEEVEKAETSGPYEAAEQEAKEGESEGAEGGSEGSAEPEEAGGAAGEAGGSASAGGETLELAASPTELAYDKKTLTSNKSGKVTIDLENPSAIEHDVAIEQNGKEIAVSETIKESSTSVTADLKPGTYTFLCTIPGHAEAGMEGTLVVK
jgi:plastocyanin